MKYANPFLPLPLDEWNSTKQTLHLYTQIVGKIRMALSPPKNHWWHAPLYVTTQGLGTHLIPYGARSFEINFDFLRHRLSVITNANQEDSFALDDGLSVSEFYHNLLELLGAFDITADILARPYGLDIQTPFAKDVEHHSYEKQYIERFWHILTQIEYIFNLFNSSFYGKVCPPQLYWHSFDLAVTRFSGRSAPAMAGGSSVDREAYSHEVISFGFWAGDQNVPDPAFYSYTYPSPRGLEHTMLQPRQAFWTTINRSPMALLTYFDMCKVADPREALLQFLESAYQSGARKAGWDSQLVQRAHLTA